jgi:glycosyltransferase involved in cell wall biosynthesis
VEVPARTGRDPRLRAELGFADDDYVLVAPGESTRPAGHGDAFWAAGILHVLSPRYRILLWGRGASAPAVARFAGKVDQSQTLVLAEPTLRRRVDFAEILAAADAVLFTPGGPTAILSFAVCMAAGLPIVTTPTPWLGDFLEDGRNALVVPRRSSRMLAQRIIELRSDAALQTRICESARSQARELFSVRQFVEQYRDLYRKIAGSDRL